MIPQKLNSVDKVIKDAEFKRNQLKGYKAQVSRAYNKGKINDVQKQMEYKRIDNGRAVFFNQYIGYYTNKSKSINGSGQKTKKGGNVFYLNDPKQLLKKLEIIVGEIMAGKTSVNMRNMAVTLFDALLRTSAIN